MEEPNEDKDSPNLDPSPSNLVKNSDELQNVSRDLTESPNHEQVDGVNLSAKVKVIHNAKNRNSTESTMEEDPLSNEENNSDEYLNNEEQVFHGQVLLPALENHGSSSSLNCKYPSCDFTSSNFEDYIKHVDTHVSFRPSHVEEGSFHCDICNMKFVNYANMHRHKLLHMGIRSFECQHCSKRFLQKDQLVEHLVKHTKQRPYRCPFCIRSFSFRPHLKTHLSSDHAGIIIDKTCRLCDFKASSPNGAKIHFAMCHLKQSPEASDSDATKIHDVYSRETQIHMVPTQNGAIDLATVSQNFSFMPAQYAHFPTVTNESVAIPGPSDLSRTATKVVHLPAQTVHIVPQASAERAAVHDREKVSHTCVSASAGSTTVVSPISCQDRPCCRHDTRNDSDHMHQDEVCIKPEPPELSVDDSQNSNVQPTSTMDLTTTDVVETTSGPCSSGLSRRRKAHKHSSGDETSSESYQSPTNRNCQDSQSAHIASSRNAHSCYRVRHCDESGSQRCRGYSRHTCNTFRHNTDKRTRLSESETCRDPPNDNADWLEHKVFYNRATSTESTADACPRTVRRGIVPPQPHNSDPGTSENRTENHFFDNKTTIAIQHIESFTLTCPFCEIIFPDQTLYLLHRSLHSEASPWKCNLCGKTCKDKYDFNSHVISKGHY